MSLEHTSKALRSRLLVSLCVRWTWQRVDGRTGCCRSSWGSVGGKIVHNWHVAIALYYMFARVWLYSCVTRTNSSRSTTHENKDEKWHIKPRQQGTKRKWLLYIAYGCFVVHRISFASSACLPITFTIIILMIRRRLRGGKIAWQPTCTYVESEKKYLFFDPLKTYRGLTRVRNRRVGINRVLSND